jgi:hypothetical protein
LAPPGRGARPERIAVDDDGVGQPLLAPPRQCVDSASAAAPLGDQGEDRFDDRIVVTVASSGGRCQDAPGCLQRSNVVLERRCDQILTTPLPSHRLYRRPHTVSPAEQHNHLLLTQHRAILTMAVAAMLHDVRADRIVWAAV